MKSDNIKQYLTPDLCKDAGIIVINLTDRSISLGAMNPDYIKVKQVVKKIESESERYYKKNDQGMIGTISLGL